MWSRKTGQNTYDLVSMSKNENILQLILLSTADEVAQVQQLIDALMSICQFLSKRFSLYGIYARIKNLSLKKWHTSL